MDVICLKSPLPTQILEHGVAQAFDAKELTNFNVAHFASIPHE